MYYLLKQMLFVACNGVVYDNNSLWKHALFFLFKLQHLNFKTQLVVTWQTGSPQLDKTMEKARLVISLK